MKNSQNDLNQDIKIELLTNDPPTIPRVLSHIYFDIDSSEDSNEESDSSAENDSDSSQEIFSSDSSDY